MPKDLKLSISFDREDDGRWIAEIEALPGCLAYGATSEQAGRRAIALALNILADRMAQDEPEPTKGLAPLSWHVGFEAQAA